MKPIIWWSVAILLGLLFVGGAVSNGLTAKPPDVVRCGSDVMNPGDVCEETKRGSRHEYSYTEMKDRATSSDLVGGWVMLVGGAALAVVGSVKLVAAVRRRRAGVTGPPPGPYPMPYQQPYQQPPFQQPQFQQQYAPPPQYQQYPPQQYPPQQFGPGGS